MMTPGLVLSGLSSADGQHEVLGELLRHSETTAVFSVGGELPGHRLLDPVMCGVEETLKLYRQAGHGTELVVLFGSRGLFDAIQVPGHEAHETAPASPAQLASLLGVPVVVVINITGMAQTVGAVVKGMSMADPKVQIRGVLLRGASSATHRELCRAAVESQGIRVLEDIREVISVATSAEMVGEGDVDKQEGRCVVAVTGDTQPEWADALRAAGAQVREFNPVVDPVPECGGLVIGGAVVPDVRDHVGAGRALHVQGTAAWKVAEQLGLQAESGDFDPGRYREAVAMTDSAMFPAGFRVVGVDAAPALLGTPADQWQPLWAWKDGTTGRVIREGLHWGGVSATALRVHPAALAPALRRFLDTCS